MITITEAFADLSDLVCQHGDDQDRCALNKVENRLATLRTDRMSKAVADRLKARLKPADSMYHLGFEWFREEVVIAIIDSLTEAT